jgi:hypothetical protein
MIKSRTLTLAIVTAGVVFAILSVVLVLDSLEADGDLHKAQTVVMDIGGWDEVSESNGHAALFEYPDIDRLLGGEPQVITSTKFRRWLEIQCQSKDQRLRRRAEYTMVRIDDSGQNPSE